MKLPVLSVSEPAYFALLRPRPAAVAIALAVLLGQISLGAEVFTSTEGLPPAPMPLPQPSPAADWLISPPARKAAVYRGSSPRDLVLDNGLIRRCFRLEPNVATVAFDNLMTGAGILRAVRPEATISLQGKTYSVGGLGGQPEQAYLLPEWLEQMKVIPGSFRCTGFEMGPTQAPFSWKRRRHSLDLPWPAPGVALHFHYQAPEGELQGLKLEVHYELYDALPVLGKWITLENRTDQPVLLDEFTSEILAPAEVESAVDERPFRNWKLPAIDLLSDYSFHGMDATTASQTAVWLPDPTYTSQVNYELKMPAMLVSRPPLGPAQRIAPGERFESFRTYLVVHDTDSRERQGLALRRAQRTLAPWTTENPIMMHVRSAESRVFRDAVDQCAEVGFEMIIYTFGSGLDMENVNSDYLARVKADVDYAHSKGIEVGAYSLLASRRVNDENDVINPNTGKPGGAIFGHSPCLCSRWGEEYFTKIKRFITETGLDLLEHDGSYPGDICASTRHPGHQGLKDSQWAQWRTITALYQWCRERGVYLNVPDYYFLAGSSKTGMGYRESNWSLPRERQIIVGRQNIYDGTWTKAPSMGWMFVPLVEYQGGGSAATLEPLHEHLDAYEGHLANNFAAGVQACYRGPRLYDTDATKAVVKKWVGWFKQHRDLLESDIIHLRRPDGKNIDCFLHVSPAPKHQALAALFNPLSKELEQTLELPLYYAGLSDQVRVQEHEREAKVLKLDRQYRLSLSVRLPPGGISWFTFSEP